MTKPKITADLDAQFAAFQKADEGKPPPKVLADLRPGTTTIYDAAMEWTKHSPRHSGLGINGRYGPTTEKLESYMRCLDARPGQETPGEVFDVLNACLVEGRLNAIKPVYISGTTDLNPFLTLVAFEDLQRILDARQDAQHGAGTRAEADTGRKKRGPPPATSDALTAKIVADFRERPDQLKNEKFESLGARYGVKVGGTLTRAYNQAVAQLREATETLKNSEKH